MVSPGDVVVVPFAGAVLTKIRPVVVLTVPGYHAVRPDCIVGILTSNPRVATTAFDHVLADWEAAGLSQPSAFRTYVQMVPSTGLRVVGALSARDFEAVRVCAARALGLR